MKKVKESYVSSSDIWNPQRSSVVSEEYQAPYVGSIGEGLSELLEIPDFECYYEYVVKGCYENLSKKNIAV